MDSKRVAKLKILFMLLCFFRDIGLNFGLKNEVNLVKKIQIHNHQKTLFTINYKLIYN